MFVSKPRKGWGLFTIYSGPFSAMTAVIHGVQQVTLILPSWMTVYGISVWNAENATTRKVQTKSWFQPIFPNFSRSAWFCINYWKSIKNYIIDNGHDHILLTSKFLCDDKFVAARATALQTCRVTAKARESCEKTKCFSLIFLCLILVGVMNYGNEMKILTILNTRNEMCQTKSVQWVYFDVFFVIWLRYTVGLCFSTLRSLNRRLWCFA